MGENLAEPGRMAVRTPMQWTSEPTGGFSDAPADRLIAPMPDNGFGPAHVNVADQRSDPESLLSFLRRLIFRYRQHPELGWGEFSVIDQPNHAVLVHRSRWQDNSVVAVHNLSGEGTQVGFTIDDLPTGTTLVDILGDERVPMADGRVELVLDGYGFRWLRVQHPEDHRLW